MEARSVRKIAKLIGARKSTVHSTLGAANNEGETMETMASMSGKTFRVIEIAAKELERRGRQVDKYKIIVRRRSDAMMVVSFLDPDQPPTVLGSGPNLVGLAVEVDATKLEIIASHFIK